MNMFVSKRYETLELSRLVSKEESCILEKFLAQKSALLSQMFI